MLTELIQAAEIRDIVVSERMKVYEASFKFDIGKLQHMVIFQI